MDRMAGLALAGAGLGAAALGVAGATGNLPVSKQQQLEQLKAQGIEPTPEEEKEARDEQLMLLGAAALAIGAGTGVGAGSAWALDAAEPSASKADAAIMRRLAAASPQMAAEVQAIMDRKAGKAPPLRMEATPLPAEQRFAGSPEVVQQAVALQTPLLGSRGQRLTGDPAALQASLRRIGEVFEKGDIWWDEQLPTNRKMTPAQVRARELNAIGEAMSLHSPQWYGELIDAVGDSSSYNHYDPNVLRVLGKAYDYNQAARKVLATSAYLDTMDNIARVEPSLAPQSITPLQYVTPEEFEQIKKRPRKVRSTTQDYNYRFDDNAPPDWKQDAGLASFYLMNHALNHPSLQSRPDDRALVKALATSALYNDTERMNSLEALELSGALHAQDLDGWLDLQAYKAHHAGQAWQEPEVPAVWRSPEFYVTTPKQNPRIEEIAQNARAEAAQSHHDLMERTGARGFRERLRSGLV